VLVCDVCTVKWGGLAFSAFSIEVASTRSGSSIPFSACDSDFPAPPPQLYVSRLSTLRPNASTFLAWASVGLLARPANHGPGGAVAGRRQER
jgi:hypothetical protein